MDPRVEFSALNRFGIIPEFDNDPGGSNGRGGPRAFEDLLLANVHEMRIEVWDDRLADYVPLRHERVNALKGEPGDYHWSRMVNTAAGPSTVTDTPGSPSGPAVFDTWHPGINLDFDGNGTVSNAEKYPPYLSYDYYPPDRNDSPPGPSPVYAPADTSKKDYWRESTTYSAGDSTAVPPIEPDIVFARNATDSEYFGWDADGDGLYDWEADSLFATLNSLPPLPPQRFQIAYRCISGGTSGASAPKWPTKPGQIVQDGGVTWLAVDNRRPLKAIRITFQFENQQSGQMRQLTLELSLMD